MQPGQPLPTFESFAASRVQESAPLSDIFAEIAEVIKEIDPKMRTRGANVIGFKYKGTPFVLDLQDGMIVLTGDGGSESWEFDIKSISAIRQQLRDQFLS